MSEAAQLIWKLKGVFPNYRSSSNDQSQSESFTKTILTNSLFRLHSNVTFIFLILSSLLVFIQQLMGIHIKCLMPDSEEASSQLRSSAVTTYCFVTGTYTLSNQNPNQLYSHPGVGTHIEGGESVQKFHHYFQWVPFILFLEGILFCIPYRLWRAWEGDKLFRFLIKVETCGDSASEELNLENTFISASPTMDAAKYFTRNLGCNKLYSFYFLFSELLNFLLVLGVFWVNDWFLGGQFQYFGWDYFRYVMANRGMELPVLNDNRITKEISPLDKIFPKVSKCDFQKFGPSGEIIKYDILCILSLNVISEKIFLILWAWLILLFLLGILLFLYRTILIIFPTARAYLILQGSIRKDHPQIKFILNNIGGYGDWFFLKKISESLDSDKFGRLCKEVAKTLLQESQQFPSKIRKYAQQQGQFSGEGEEMSMAVFSSKNNGQIRKRRPVYDDIPLVPIIPEEQLPDDRSLYNFRAIREEHNSLKRLDIGSLTQITVHSNDDIVNNSERQQGKSENIYN